MVRKTNMKQADLRAAVEGHDASEWEHIVPYVRPA